MVIGGGGLVLLALVVEESDFEAGFGFSGGEAFEVIPGLAGLFGVWCAIDVVLEGFAGFEPCVSVVASASEVGHPHVTDLVLCVVCDGICGVAFHHGLVGDDGFLSAALAFEEEADVVLSACGEL